MILGFYLAAIGLTTIIGTSLSLVAGLAFGVLFKGKSASANNRASIDDLQIQTAKEGIAIPWILGDVKLSPNVIAYQKLRSKAIEQGGGGKGGFAGGGGTESTVGYKYFLDVWFGICQGKVQLLKIFLNDEEKETSDIPVSNTAFNDGENGVFPSWFPNATETPTIAHLAYERWHFGDNTTNLPPFHVLVRRVLPTTISNANLAKGSNPSAAIYQAYIDAKVDKSLLDKAAFEVAAAYYNSKNIGVNLEFKDVTDVRDVVRRILQYVDGVVYRTDEGLHTIKALDPSDSASATLTEKDMSDFKFHRPMWRKVPNKFIGTFKDRTQNYTTRTVKDENPAAILLAKREILKNVDLTAFLDLDLAQQRLSEIAQRESYPAAEIRFNTSLKFFHLNPGDVIEVSYSDYGIVSAKFRIVSKTIPKPDSNQVKWSAKQMVESLHDDTFQTVQEGTQFEPIGTEPEDITNVKFFELPYNKTHGETPTFLVFAAREKGFESECQVRISDNATQDFNVFGSFTSFANHGVLTADYSRDTDLIEDTDGIFFQPTEEFEDFVSVSENTILSSMRVALINDELIGFRDYLPQGNGTVKLLGIVRGLLRTPVQAHSTSDQIFIGMLSDNVLKDIPFDPYHARLLPLTQGKRLEFSDTTNHEVNQVQKAANPITPGRVTAERTGTNLDVKVYPLKPTSIAMADDFFEIHGDFESQIDSDPVVFQSSNEFSLTIPVGPVSLKIRHRVNGNFSSTVTVSVGAGDGTYQN